MAGKCVSPPSYLLSLRGASQSLTEHVSRILGEELSVFDQKTTEKLVIAWVLTISAVAVISDMRFTTWMWVAGAGFIVLVLLEKGEVDE